MLYWLMLRHIPAFHLLADMLGIDLYQSGDQVLAMLEILRILTYICGAMNLTHANLSGSENSRGLPAISITHSEHYDLRADCLFR